jgi:DNA-directed RNA polymerase subunit H (RpoH/RPB5)
MDTLFSVYRNIYELLRFRNYQIRSPQQEKDEFIEYVNKNEYIIIESIQTSGIRKDKLAKTILFKQNCKFLSSSGEFKKIIRHINKDEPESLLLIREPIPEKPFGHKANPWSNFFIKHLSEKMFVESFDYRKFIINMPLHICWVPQEIMDDTEIKQFLEENRKNVTALHGICRDDTSVIWLGARPGDIIKVRRPSESSGEAIVYRQVKKTYAFA